MVNVVVVTSCYIVSTFSDCTIVLKVETSGKWSEYLEISISVAAAGCLVRLLAMKLLSGARSTCVQCDWQFDCRMKHDTKVGGATRGRVIRVIWGYWHDIKNRLPVMSTVAWKVNLWSQLTFLLRTKMVQNKLYGPSRWEKNPIDKVWHWNAYTFIDTIYLTHQEIGVRSRPRRY